MARVRLSTTVDEELLAEARGLREGTDASLIDNALRALLARHRASRIDALYDAGYTLHPLDEPDEWGDLASFRDAAGSS